MAKYLITGGAGFIGSNILKYLLENNEDVRVIDNFVTGKKENISEFKGKFELIEGDFSDLDTVRRAVKGVDYVLHQGAIPSVPRSVDDPLKTNQANIAGTLNMLIAARDEEVKRFVYAASSSAYGDSPVMPKQEDMKVSPKSPYAIQKLAGEQYCQSFYRLYGLPTICLRYFNVFGPKQDPDSVYSAVIPLFIKLIAADQTPTINGNGDISRDFTYVENNIIANILAAKTENQQAFGEVLNIATGQEVSLDQLVDQINQILGKQVQADYGEPRRGDIAHSLADITRAKELIAYEPIVSFTEGLKRTVDYYTN